MALSLKWWTDRKANKDYSERESGPGDLVL